jgi:Arc/MetJ family transcription regulator
MTQFMYTVSPVLGILQVAITMKTHVDVDDGVLREVMRMGNFSSKKTAINAALGEYLRKLKRLDLLAMRGNVPWVGDLDALRGSRRDGE